MSLIPPGPYNIIFSPEGTFPPPIGARQAAGREIERPIVVEPVGPEEPGVFGWRLIPSNEGENMYGIFGALKDREGFALAGNEVVPDARVIFGSVATPFVVQVRKVEGGYFGTIQARTPLIGATPYLSVEGDEVVLKFVPVVPDAKAPGQWFLRGAN